MNSRERILQEVLKNTTPGSPVPDISMFKGDYTDVVEKYIDVFTNIGGSAFLVNDLNEIRTLIGKQFNVANRVVTTLPELSTDFELLSIGLDPHALEDVELAVIRAHFGVAENGAVWLTDDLMGQRIIPYICQHLVVIVDADSIVPTLHEAYEQIGIGDYGFAGFIGGPSKTADIEQALVLGAHGPLSMTVFILK